MYEKNSLVCASACGCFFIHMNTWQWDTNVFLSFYPEDSVRFLRVNFSIFVPLSRDILWLLRAKVWKTKEYRSTTEWNSCPTVKGSIELFSHWVKSCQTVKSKHQQCWARNVESDCTIVSEMSVLNWKRDQMLKLFPSSESTSMSKASKSSILRKKLQAEKLALKLKIAVQKCEEQISLLRAKAKQRAKLLELKRRGVRKTKTQDLRPGKLRPGKLGPFFFFFF